MTTPEVSFDSIYQNTPPFKLFYYLFMHCNLVQSIKRDKKKKLLKKLVQPFENSRVNNLSQNERKKSIISSKQSINAMNVYAVLSSTYTLLNLVLPLLIIFFKNQLPTFDFHVFIYMGRFCSSGKKITHLKHKIDFFFIRSRRQCIANLSPTVPQEFIFVLSVKINVRI